MVCATAINEHEKLHSYSIALFILCHLLTPDIYLAFWLLPIKFMMTSLSSFRMQVIKKFPHENGYLVKEISLLLVLLMGAKMPDPLSQIAEI